MNEKECLEAIAGGDDAYFLLLEADPKLEARWKRLCGNIIKYLEDVKKHFPDATYYTASGGFNLLLGNSHSETVEGKSQEQLIALHGPPGLKVGDGDF